MDTDTWIYSDTEKVQFEPLNWLKDAKIYNKKREFLPPNWLAQNANVIALLFTAKGIDREGIVQKFYTIYESCKYLNLPVEVIYIPLDEDKNDFEDSYSQQANWFTLKFDDPLVPMLKYLYGVTCIPHIIVIKPDCTVISTHGILDLEKYAKNAVITWLDTTSETKSHRRMSKDAAMYGKKWLFASAEGGPRKLQKRYTSAAVPALPTEPELKENE